MRRFLKILAGLFVVVAVAVAAAVFLIPRDRIVALATDQVRAATGRELTLSGDLSPSFWPVLGVRTGGVTLSNAEWGEADHLVAAQSAQIGVELMPLFSGEVKVATLRLVEPVVSLEVNGDGLGNWVFDREGGAPKSDVGTGEGRDLKLSLPEAVISNGTIRFFDAQTGQRIELSELDLTAGLAALDAPLTLDGAGLWNGERTRLELRVETPQAAMDGRRADVTLALRSDPATVTFDGAVQADPAASLPLIDGVLAVDIPSPAAAAGWATGTGAPAGLADLGAVKLTGNVAATEAALQMAAKGTIGYRGRAVGFDLTANGGAGWLERQAFSVALEGAVDGLLQASFNGPVSAGGTVAAEGPLRLTVSDIGALAEWATGERLATPAGTLESATLESGLAFAGDQIELAGLVMTIDQTRLTGNAAMRMGGKPHISANLDSGPLDLTPFLAKEGGGGGSGNGGKQGWSTEPLDLSALRSVDADVAIRAEAVDLGEIEIGRSDIAATLREGRLDMQIDRVDAYGGGMSGTVLVHALDAPRVAADLTVSQVQLRPLLNALAGFDSLEGLGAFRINVTGGGGSMDALMRSLNGNGALELTDGAILGLNLAAMVRNLTGQGGGQSERTDFSAVTGTFDITNGVLHNADFSFLGPLLRVVGAGTVDIGNQTQNFRLEPTAVASLTGQGGAIGDSGLGVFPILITGSWSNPKIRPDLTAAITGFLTDPNKTIDAVTGIVSGDPTKAAESLLGTLGGGGDDQSGGALGQVLGGALGQGGQQQQSGQSQGGTGQQPAEQSGGLLGGLLGSLGGKKKKDQQGGAALPQATETQPAQSSETTVAAASGAEISSGTAEPDGIDATELAPVVAPVPRAAPRTAALGLPGTGDAAVQETIVPQSATEALQNAVEPQPLSQEQPATGEATQETVVETAPAQDPAQDPATQNAQPAGEAAEDKGGKKKSKPEKLLKKLFN